MVQLTNEELQLFLMDAYDHQTSAYPESEHIKTLKNELYRRGYRRGDIVSMALASVIHRRRETLRRTR